MVGVSEFALRPLINEIDPNIRANTIQKVGEDVLGKQYAGRGYKKKITAEDVKAVIEDIRLGDLYVIALKAYIIRM